MRLINADIIEFHNLESRICPDETAQDIIDEQPTVDAVPVVRCGKCKYSIPDLPDMPKESLYCKHDGIDHGPEGYCDLGERKDGEK